MTEPVTCFVGCSYTSGEGWELSKDDPRLWTNLLHKNVSELAATQQVNLGVAGSSNQKIFKVAVNALLTHTPEYIFVQWTSYPRYVVELGFELYSSRQTVSFLCKSMTHNLHNFTYNEDYLDGIRNRFCSLNHPHNEIKSIVSSVNILINLASKLGSKLFFINGMCDWDLDYFSKLENVKPNQYTPYTQKLLDTETRDDTEIFELYNKLHQSYSSLGGIQHNHWLNLYKSQLTQLIDKNADGLHPGTKSNINYADLFKSSLTQKI